MAMLGADRGGTAKFEKFEKSPRFECPYRAYVHPLCVSCYLMYHLLTYLACLTGLRFRVEGQGSGFRV